MSDEPMRGEFGQGKSQAALLIAAKLRETADMMHSTGMDMIRHKQAPYYQHGMELTNAAAMAHSWAREIEEEEGEECETKPARRGE